MEGEGQTAIYTCPTSRVGPSGMHAIIGCGATFCAAPDAEGLVDCPECGIWFDPVREGQSSELSNER